MKTIEELIANGEASIKAIFERNGIKAPVTPKNVANAIVAVPAVRKEIAAKFDGFGEAIGREEEEENELDETYEGFGFDNATGKKKKEKKPKTAEEKQARNEKLKGMFQKGINAVNTAKNLKDTLKGSGAPTEESTPEEPVKKEVKKIMGLTPVVFWSIVAVIALIIIFLIVRAFK